MFYLISTNIHKSMMLPCMPFNIVFGRSAILPGNVSFDHHIHSEIHYATTVAEFSGNISFTLKDI